MGLPPIVGSNPTLSAAPWPGRGCLGGVAEWSNALVLKTSVPSGTGGSNPSPSAMGPGSLYLGLDLGTSGLRGLASDAAGYVVAESRQPWDRSTVDPKLWWQALTGVTRSLAQSACRLGRSVRGLAVVGTSGTLICADRDGEALAPAIQYNDSRAHREAELLEAAQHPVPFTFSASFSLPKAHWVRRRRPALFARTARLCHPADWMIGRLTGVFASDYSNALKMGYDLIREAWPAWIDEEIRERLPPVAAPGTIVGHLSRHAARETHLPRGLPVLAGATDGTAGALASGLQRCGDYNTSLGTTLIFKGLSRKPVQAPHVYSHRLPGGLWLPGAASNTGAAWIEHWFRGHAPAQLDQQAAALLPTSHLAYPLIGTGERFPFVNLDVQGFLPEGVRLAERYAACLQGTALLERRAYDILDCTMGTSGGAVYATGGGSRSDEWMQCRADVCHRLVYRAACPEAAMGAAILAAAGTDLGDVTAAMRSMTRVAATFEPRSHSAYDEAYVRFIEQLHAQ